MEILATDKKLEALNNQAIIWDSAATQRCWCLIISIKELEYFLNNVKL